MIKKSIFLFFLTLFLYSCKGIELKHLNPIPTKANDGGFPGLVQDTLTGDWDRFKEDENTQDKSIQDKNKQMSN